MLKLYANHSLRYLALKWSLIWTLSLWSNPRQVPPGSIIPVQER